MDEPVTHSYDATPGDFGMAEGHIVRQTLDSFSDDLEASSEGALQDLRPIDLKVYGLRENPCFSPVIEGFQRKDVDRHRKSVFQDIGCIHECVESFSALFKFQEEVYIRIRTGIAPRC